VPRIVQFRSEFARFRHRIVSYRIGIVRIRAAIVSNRAKTCGIAGLWEKRSPVRREAIVATILLEQPVAVELLDKYV
jgi:hypothetical protein